MSSKDLTNFPSPVDAYKTKDGKVVRFLAEEFNHIIDEYGSIEKIPSEIICDAQEYIKEESLGIKVGFSDSVYRKGKIIEIDNINACQLDEIISYDDGVFRK